MTEWYPVNSSLIDQVGYDEEEKTLSVVTSNGQQYDTPNVESSTFQEMLNSPSIGVYYRTHIMMLRK